MGDDRWVKFKVNMYENIKLKILDEMDNRDLYHYVWARCIVLAGKLNQGGYLYITDSIPYTIKTLAIEFNRTVEEVKAAFKILRKLEMIEFTEDKVFKIKNWEKHQNVEGMERGKKLNNERVARFRAKKKEMIEKSKNEPSSSIKDMDKDEDKKLNNIDEQLKEDTCEIFGNLPKDNVNNEDNIENKNDIQCEDNCNVTGNAEDLNCNITVMGEIKKEKKNKNKNKKEIENESNLEIIDKDIDFGQTGDSEKENDNNQDAAKLLKYYENITGILGGLNIGGLKIAIDMHGYKNVKMAINKALEVNKANMTYINGILKNWRREGYPKDDTEVKKNGVRSAGKNNSGDKNEFAGFKPKEPRKLTEEQRKKAEEKLL